MEEAQGARIAVPLLQKLKKFMHYIKTTAAFTVHSLSFDTQRAACQRQL